MQLNLEARREAVLDKIDSYQGGRLLLALVREVADDDVVGMAAEMAYRFLFSVFPLLLLMVAALGFIGQAIGFEDLFATLLAEARPFLPGRIYDTLEGYLTHLLTYRSGTFLTIGLIGTLWGAAGGVGTLIKGLNRAYDAEQVRPFWKRQIVAIVTTLTLPPTGLLLMASALLGRQLAEWLGRLFGRGDDFVVLLATVRWPVLIALLFFLLAVLYHFLPGIRHRFVWSLPGSAFATTGWLVITWAFSLYMDNFANYDVTYGSFGAIMAFLLWLYFIGLVILVGAEINALLEPTQRKHWRAVSTARPDKAEGGLDDRPIAKPQSSRQPHRATPVHATERGNRYP